MYCARKERFLKGNKPMVRVNEKKKINKTKTENILTIFENPCRTVLPSRFLLKFFYEYILQVCCSCVLECKKTCHLLTGQLFSVIFWLIACFTMSRKFARSRGSVFACHLIGNLVSSSHCLSTAWTDDSPKLLPGELGDPEQVHTPLINIKDHSLRWQNLFR